MLTKEAKFVGCVDRYKGDGLWATKVGIRYGRGGLNACLDRLDVELEGQKKPNIFLTDALDFGF